jgi:DNA topoisomerase VI subunit B
MSRGQQGIGISAAGMYGQLTTGTSTKILSRTGGKKGHYIEVQIDTRKNTPAILKDEEVDWRPEFPVPGAKANTPPLTYPHGTSVSIEMEAAYVRGRLSVDEYLKQCAVVNPHLQLHYRIVLKKEAAEEEENGKAEAKALKVDDSAKKDAATKKRDVEKPAKEEKADGKKSVKHGKKK